jgi:hypothetical protein
VKSEWIGLIMIGAAAVLFISNKADQQQPVPVPDGETIAVTGMSSAFRREEQLLRVAVRQAVSDLRAGKIATDAVARDYLAAAKKAAEKAAWTPIAQKDESRLGGGKWTAEEHAKVLEEMLSE